MSSASTRPLRHATPLLPAAAQGATQRPALSQYLRNFPEGSFRLRAARPPAPARRARVIGAVPK